jgi:hypothetical protein
VFSELALISALVFVAVEDSWEWVVSQADLKLETISKTF